MNLFVNKSRLSPIPFHLHLRQLRAQDRMMAGTAHLKPGDVDDPENGDMIRCQEIRPVAGSHAVATPTRWRMEEENQRCG